MEGWPTIAIVYAAGVLLLLADFFLPSHGLLTLASMGVLGYGLYLTFGISQEAGFAGLGILLVTVPSVLALMVKYWHRTWVGKRISPANPVLTQADRLPVDEIAGMVGRTGRSLTPLRPVGMCLFDDRRIECVAEQGVIGPNAEVEGVRMSDRTLVVRVSGRAQERPAPG